MSPKEALADIINSLEADRKEAAWNCVDTIELALDNVGDMALTVLHYSLEEYHENAAKILIEQEDQIERMAELLASDAERHSANVREINELKAENHRLAKKVKKAKKHAW
jgi:hypothetical protein